MRVPNLPEGINYGLTVSSASGSYARHFFVHNGAPLSLALQAGSAIQGKLVPRFSGETLEGRSANIRWSHTQGGQKTLWGGEVTGFLLDADGSFRLHTPMAIPRSPGALPAASAVSLSIEVPGFAQRSVSFEAPPCANVDLGEIQLQRSGEELTLSMGYPFQSGELKYNTFFSSPVDNSLAFDISDVISGEHQTRVVLGDIDGSGLYRAFDYNKSKYVEVEWKGMPRLIALPELGATQFRVFQRTDGAVYAEVDRAAYRVVVNLPDNSTFSQRRMGWAWGDLLVPLRLSAQAEGKAEIIVNAPPNSSFFAVREGGEYPDFWPMVLGVNEFFIQGH